MNHVDASAATRKIANGRSMRMRRGKLIAAALAMSLALGMGAAPAWAYFTDTHHADGGLPIKGQPDVEIHEWYAQATKHVVIANDAETGAPPVYVRAKVQTSLPFTAAGSNWTTEPDANGWYYYETELAAGAETEELTVGITFPTVKSEEEPNGAVYGDNYSVIVLYESVPVIHDEEGNLIIYDADGNPIDDSDWSYKWSAEEPEGGN